MSLPPASVLLRAAQIAIDEDKPIYLDYYRESLEKTCCIGVQETTKYLVKSDSEYTSTIQNVFKCDNALYLDGVISKLYFKDPKSKKNTLPDDTQPLGPMISVCEKKSK